MDHRNRIMIRTVAWVAIVLMVSSKLQVRKFEIEKFNIMLKKMSLRLQWSIYIFKIFVANCSDKSNTRNCIARADAKEVVKNAANMIEDCCATTFAWLCKRGKWAGK